MIRLEKVSAYGVFEAKKLRVVGSVVPFEMVWQPSRMVCFIHGSPDMVCGFCLLCCFWLGREIFANESCGLPLAGCWPEIVAAFGGPVPCWVSRCPKDR